jgi:acyl-CoA thioesterase-1
MNGRRIQCVIAVALVGACTSGKTPAGNVAMKSDSTHTSAVVTAKRNILFLGTSLTVGLGLDPDSAYPQQLQRKIDSAGLSFRTINSGVSGETSADLLRRLDWVLQQPAAVIVVETGANDGLRGLSVAGTKASIRDVLTRIRKERPDARIVLAQMEAPPNLGTQYTSAFHAMFPSLAEEFGVTLMPFFLDSVAGHPALNQNDGIHPNLEGERIVTRAVWRTLEPVLRMK